MYNPKKVFIFLWGNYWKNVNLNIFFKYGIHIKKKTISCFLFLGTVGYDK